MPNSRYAVLEIHTMNKRLTPRERAAADLANEVVWNPPTRGKRCYLKWEDKVQIPEILKSVANVQKSIIEKTAFKTNISITLLEDDPDSIMVHLGALAQDIFISHGDTQFDNDEIVYLMEESSFCKRFKVAMKVTFFAGSTRLQVNYYAPNGKFEVSSKLKTLDGFLKKAYK